jgi:CBS domain-containing protein
MRQEQSNVCAGSGTLDRVVLQSHATSDLTAADIMQCGAVTIRSDTPAFEAIGVLVGNNVSSLPVADDDRLVGMVSEKDVLEMVVGSQPLSDTVADLMMPDVITCDQETSVPEICACFTGSPICCIPVMRADQLIGVVSRADVILAYKERCSPHEFSPRTSTGIDGPFAGDVMNRGLLTVGPDTPVYQAMDLLTRWNITGLPVVDDCLKLVGIVSEKDLLSLFCRPEVRPASVREIMTTEIVSFEENTPLLDIYTCLAHSAFRRVPILNQGRLAGIISRRDLIVYLLRTKPKTFAPCARRRSDYMIALGQNH